MRKILSIALVGASFLLAGCGDEKVSKPAQIERSAEASNSVPREAREPVKPIADWTGVADKISALPGVGATRAEFEQHHTQTDADSVANITYDDNALIVQFLDERGDETESKTARASSVTVWDTQGRNFKQSDIDRLIPFDATDLKHEDVHTDDTKLVKTVHGTSATLAKIFPASNGVFGGSFVWDKSAGEFVSGTMAVIFPSPDE